MRNLLIFILLVTFSVSCQEKPQLDAQNIISRFHESADTINTVEYRIRKSDSYGEGKVSHSEGMAVVEKNESDTIFGFSFYGQMDDYTIDSYYHYPYCFEIDEEERAYKQYPADFRFIGSPGGQMIHTSIFKLENEYLKVSMNETDSSFQLKYELKDDTTFNITEIVHSYELEKESLFPVKIAETAVRNQKQLSFTREFKDVKFNDQVSKTISDFKLELADYSIIRPKEPEPSPFLGKKLPELNLSDLFNDSKLVNIGQGTILLIDFWEVWCGPCISSFPKIEELNKKYRPNLTVIGILSDDPADAKKLVEKKKLTFQNLIGNDLIKKQFGVNSFPRYYLVDKNGIVRKEYFGFSEAIEEDIKEFIQSVSPEGTI
ncbi:MAG: TlpA disulfide reductase family protein [Bacteroidota bacterium]